MAAVLTTLVAFIFIMQFFASFCAYIIFFVCKEDNPVTLLDIFLLLLFLLFAMLSYIYYADFIHLADFPPFFTREITFDFLWFSILQNPF